MTDGVIPGLETAPRRVRGGLSLPHLAGPDSRDEWLTPPSMIHALGPFDLDPCAPPPARRPWPTAADHYWSPMHDGLALPWRGRVWLNPPYGRDLGRWLERLAVHGDGTALVFARTDTHAFHRWIWPMCSAVLFVEGRVRFHESTTGALRRDGGAPSILVAYDATGHLNAERLQSADIAGAWFDCRRGTVMVPQRAWRTWRDLIGGILAEHGPMRLPDLQRLVMRRGDLPAGNRHVDAKVRQTLYLYFKRDGERWAA